MDIDPTLLQSGLPIAYLLVFLGGIVTSIGPCNMVMIPLIVGYVGGSAELSRPRSLALSFTFAVGLSITFVVLGVTAAYFWRISTAIGFQSGARAGENPLERRPRRAGPGTGVRPGIFAVRHAGVGRYSHLCNGQARDAYLRRGPVVCVCSGPRRANRIGRNVYRRSQTGSGFRPLVSRNRKSQRRYHSGGGAVFFMDSLTSRNRHCSPPSNLPGFAR